MEDMTPYQEKLDLNFAMNKDERVLESNNYENHIPKNMMEGDLNEDNSGSPVPQDFVNNEGDPVNNFSTAEDSCFAVEPSVYPDDVDSRPYSDHADGTMPIEDGHYHEKEEFVECVGASNNTDYATENSNKEIVNEGADAPSQKQPSAMDNHNDWRIEASDHQNNDTHPFDESANEFGNSEMEESELLNQETGGGSFSPQNEVDEDICPSRMLPSDNGKDNGERYYSSSPQRGRSDMPSLEGQLSVSREKSPHIHSSARQEEFANSDKKLIHSPDSSRHKHSPSPEKHVVGRKRASSHDRSSPPTKRKSPSGRMSRKAPRRHSSRSPPRRDSPRRKDRSASRSPVRGRESSRRENRGRSRSRSPYQRDRPRRSPRYSSRRRSPPAHHSHRRSPRRAWSPPANRSTGIGKPGRNLFVAGFSYTTTERDLEKKFSRFGRVMDVRIVRDKRSGDSRGFGFLSLERDEDADAAIRALDQTEWNSRIILVEKSKTSVR
ncbi:serine/arginine repetitive matrix protein 2-like [Dioscorea cayenensis subsp. rotundata]|uniref:Serine/arginine repetitive matrix protein 2-like n=1 Tax=Dioscorea cayennensis subsp. rotundata TaxID=55577 RepID=A0AB40CI72_DIOCR|nr:serine/arginine repetitive matrix protein 2-like [Dioscorea cayenensis subsp. rotundata]